MPELPEVEIMTRNLARWLGDRRLAGADLVDPRLDSEGVATWVPEAAEWRTGTVWRRGKYSVIDLQAPGRASRALVLHFRMTGKVVVGAAGSRSAERLRLHLVPEHGRPGTILFVDARHLGNAWLRPRAGLEDWFASARRLGPEPWPVVPSTAEWRARVGPSRSPVKVALLDQQRFAGLGNIAVSELLWRARVSPHARACDLDAEAWGRIAASVGPFVDATIERESGDELSYVNSRGGSRRGIASPFDVYRCHGQPCPRCATPVERFKQSGRSTFWCPQCQGAA